MFKFEQINPPAELKEKIFEKIEVASEKRAFKKKIFVFSSLFVSFIGFFQFAGYAISEFQSSGFYSYLSLFWSDSKVILSNFNEFIFSLLDSTPFFAITIALVSIFIFLLSMKYLVAINKRRFAYAAKTL